MSDLRPDTDLRERFQQLRTEDRETAPDLAAMLERARTGSWSAAEPETVAGTVRESDGGRIRRRWLWAGGTVAAAAAVALLLFDPGARADREFERVVRSYASVSNGWRLPTDALLDFPGSEITKSIPRVGIPSLPGGADGAPRRDRS